MRRRIKRCLSLVVALLLVMSIMPMAAYAQEVTDQAVADVIEQLESIDTLAQMQAKRGDYKVNSRYMANTTDEAIITAHETARQNYESYIAKMFAARAAAQQAYDGLTDAQKAQIDPALVAKLDNQLDTKFRVETCTVTPRSDAYSFEAVNDTAAGGLCYETSNHVTLGPEIPALFILVDTADGKTSWTPNGKYVPGQSNYEVTYCCDLDTGLKYGTDYKRINLEDSTYFSEPCAEKVRAIVMNSYPFITMDEMKSRLKAGGLDGDFVDQLTRSDMIAATQMSIWAYANASADAIAVNTKYGATYDIAACSTRYMNPLHDHTNESWDWWTTAAGQISYDARAEYRVNMLTYYLCNLEGVPAQKEDVVISKVEITRAELEPDSDGTYRVGMYVHLNNGGTKDDELTVTVTSYHTNADGSVTRTGRTAQNVYGKTKLPISVKANSGDTIQVEVEGTQTLERNVYFYEAEGGRDPSQNLVGMGEGKTAVYAKSEFTFEEGLGEMGLRIYKTSSEDGTPISDITFNIYKVEPDQGEALNSTPTREELEKYRVEANKVASLVTDETGYAAITLEEGIYLVDEEKHEKIVEPVAPFYVRIPMQVSVETEDGTTKVETVKVVSVYPKNEPTEPPTPPPPPPPPNDFEGKFEIIKYDAADRAILLEGAEFTVYRAAEDTDTDAEIVMCDGMPCAVVPVIYNGEKLVLRTDASGKVTSPALNCQTYFIVETKAPNGYSLLDEAVMVTVVPDTIESIITLEIPNEKGNLLPETGGMGTTPFTVTGCVLIAAATVLLVLKKKQQEYAC